MKKHLKKIFSTWIKVCKNAIYFCYRSKVEKERMLIEQLKYEKKQLTNSNEKLRLQLAVLRDLLPR